MLGQGEMLISKEPNEEVKSENATPAIDSVLISREVFDMLDKLADTVKSQQRMIEQLSGLSSKKLSGDNQQDMK